VPLESVEPANQLGYDARRREGSAVSTLRVGGAYQGALEATLAVVISVLFGVWADTKFDTSPVFFLLGLGVGFGAFILRLTRLMREVGEANDHKNDGKGGTHSRSDPVTPGDTRATHQREQQPDRDPDL
jgi:F0F1-type ATP synthase assembly protein I